MGIFDFAGSGGGRKKKIEISQSDTFRLTQEGEEKLHNFDGTARYQVLAALQSAGTSSVREISRASGIPPGKIEKEIPRLINAGYVQPTSQSHDTTDEE